MPDNLQLLTAPLAAGPVSAPRNQVIDAPLSSPRNQTGEGPLPISRNPARPPLVLTPSFRWPTPGAQIASQLVGKTEVRLVAESFDGESYGVIVLLTSDPEPLLNEIYGAEHTLYTQRWTHPFSLRVTCPGGDVEVHARRYEAGNIVHYDGRLFG